MIYDLRRPSKLGRMAAGSELKIADQDGTPVNHGEVGEVWLRAGAYPRSCCENEKLDQDVVFRDGWVRMGDLGYLDDDGFLHLVNPSDLD
jgi:acyl-CoA synthetase (AMP-forming)/AMP-acid ligase II